MGDVLGEDDQVSEDDEEDDEHDDSAPVAAPSAIRVPSLASDVVRGTGLVFPSKFRHQLMPLALCDRWSCFAAGRRIGQLYKPPRGGIRPISEK